MTLPLGLRGRFVALAILLIPLILITRYLVWPIADYYLSAADALEETRKDIARYQGLLDQAPALRSAVAELDRTAPLAPFLLSGSNRALAAAGLQRHLQEAAEKHDGSVLSLRVQNPVDDGPLERISVDARLRASIGDLRDLLYAFETTSPYLFVEDLNITVRQSRRRKTADTGQLEVRLSLYGLWTAQDPSAQGARDG